MTNSTSVGGLVVRCTLTADTSSVKAARRFVASALGTVDPDLVDTAVLVASELVTNSILHARSAVDLVVMIERSLIRIEVGDASPVPPASRGYGADASTGRGLQILDVLSTRWGVDHHDEGKRVWFEIDRADGDEIESPDLLPVTIVDLPIAAYRQASETYEGIIREFRLIVAADSAPANTPPARLLEVIATLDSRFSGFSVTQSAELDDAVASGSSSIDLTYAMPYEVGAACRELNGLLDETDAFCAEGEWLLSLVPAPEAVAFRRWFLAEFTRQVDGNPPTRFTESPEYQATFKEMP